MENMSDSRLLNKVLILILILILILLFLFTLNTNKSKINDNKYFLWTYWEKINNSPIPPYILLCRKIMQKNCSKYFNVIVLDEKNVYNYLPDLRKDIDNLPIALKTDYIRMFLLSKYGGLWVDADTIIMNDLEYIHNLLDENIDFIGFGCTGNKCFGIDGYGRPSNGVMGSKKNGLLTSRCLTALNLKLDTNNNKEFGYFDLGKKIIWAEYDSIIAQNPNYKIHHVPSDMDGTRDLHGKWISKDIIRKTNIEIDIDKLIIVMLVNSTYCGNDSRYNWFCKKSENEILNGNYFISKLFRKAINYQL